MFFHPQALGYFISATIFYFIKRYIDKNTRLQVAEAWERIYEESKEIAVKMVDISFETIID